MPGEFVEWLRITPATAWPTTFRALLQTGLEQSVIDWLEFLIAATSVTTHREQVVVTAFVYAITHHFNAASIWMKRDEHDGAKSIAGGLRKLFARSAPVPAPAVDMALAGEMRDALDGMSADAWPERIYALETE